MKIIKIFISCAGEDIKIGEKLEKDLKEQHVSPWIYTKNIKPGQIMLAEIDKALTEADYIIGVITNNYLLSIGGKEAYAKITKGLKKDKRFIPLFFIPPKEIQPRIIKSIKGFDFTKGYGEGLRELIKFLKEPKVKVNVRVKVKTIKIFISCAEEGIEIGEKLEKDLKEQPVTPWIYTKSIKPGQIMAEEIDKALAKADYVLGVITNNYLLSMGGKEAYAKITDGLQKKDMRFIPLFFIPPEETQSPIIKSIEGFDFTKGYGEGLRKLTEFLKEANVR